MLRLHILKSTWPRRRREARWRARFLWRRSLSYTSKTLKTTREDPPAKCFIPKRQIHTWQGHNKGIAVIRWFPGTAHLLLSGSSDNKVKLWEVYNKRRCVRTYSGHKP